MISAAPRLSSGCSRAFGKIQQGPAGVMRFERHSSALLPLIVATVVRADVCCQAGKFMLNTCTNTCPTTTSSLSILSNCCLSCPTGKYSIGSGSRATVTSCTDCNAGKYADTIESSSCKSCSAGRWSALSSSTCSECPSGTYSPGTGNSVCSSCPAGRYSAATAQTDSSSCEPCNMGKWAFYTGLLHVMIALLERMLPQRAVYFARAALQVASQQ